MDCAALSCPSNKEKNNFAMLCCFLIEIGPLVLTEMFNKVCSPEDLYSVLQDDTNYRKLESLKKKRRLSENQWSKLYPLVKSSVSSRDFDTSLQLLLLRNIFGLKIPASAQDNFPPVTDNSPDAGFTCIKVLRDKILHHDTSGSVDDTTFSSYWSEITETFRRFGGGHYLDTINYLKVEYLEEDLRGEYRKQLREWMRDDASTEDKLEESRIVKKARKEEDMEGSIVTSEQISGREEPKLYQHAHNGATENTEISTPELSVKIQKISELSVPSFCWKNDRLPIDVVLFTVKDDEFLSCLAYLKEPIFKSFHKSTGYVHFGSMGDHCGHKMKIALMRCSKGHDGPGGALSAAKDAISLLRPKALFSVGACNGAKNTKVKLGDVVVSSKLITLDFQIPPRSNISNLIRTIAHGWKPPVRNANECKPKVYSGAFLSISKANKDKISLFPKAIAVEKNGGGFWTAAHDFDTEWLIVKGIKGFANDSQSCHKDWKKFACVMAASVVANLLSDPVIFQDWPHFNAATSPCSAASTAPTSESHCTLL